MLYFKPFEQLELADVQALQSDGITEGRFLDYKLRPPNDSKQFLETVVSFANAQGGVIVYGVDELRLGNEKTGKIGEICGFESTAIDSIKARLENYIRDQVQPRVDYRLKEIALSDGKYLLLVRVNQGWQGPYFYRSQRGLYFHRRAESQNVLMEHSEIKDSFLKSDTLRDKLSAFRENRLQEVTGQQVPFRLDGERILTMHVLPLDSFREEAAFSHQTLVKHVATVGPISSSNYSDRPNIDGVFQYWSASGDNHTKPISYVQYFRNGTIEFADSFILGSLIDDKKMHIKAFGDRFNPSIRRAINFQKNLGLNGPFYVGVSLWNVFGLKVVQANDPWDSDADMRFDRNHIKLPIYEIQDESAAAHTMARPIIDMICNAAGWNHCFRYDTTGNWV